MNQKTKDKIRYQFTLKAILAAAKALGPEFVIKKKYIQ